jgi:hypothetical protein
MRTQLLYVFRVLILLVLYPIVMVRKWLIKRLLNLRARLRMSSLRVAIGDADKDKTRTGRKNIVVFNQYQGVYEPVQKKLLKRAARMTKNTSNKKMTEGRKRVLKIKKRVFDPERIRTIEEKSLYVTK